MTMSPLDPQQQRSQTDESLEAERHKSDQVIAAHRAELDREAEAVVALAREQADGILADARERADDTETAAGPPTADVVAQREHDDAILRQQRRDADLARRRERAALNALLPLEREKTDLLLLTERARSDDALANRDDFMGMVSHDLRNLFNNIVLNAAAVADGASDTDEGRFAVLTMGKIKASVGRMNRLISDLVDIASIDAGKLSIRGDIHDVVEVVNEAVEAVARVAAHKGVELTVAAATRPLPAWCDEGRLLQVLNNLINNALKFTAAGGSVVVGASGDDDAITIAVTDTGIGMPTAMLEAVFERFAQVAAHDKRGLGLGLYISRCIVDAHGGRIWATSTIGNGSTFYVVVPRHKKTAT